MEAIDLILKIWGIQDEHRADVQDILRTTPPQSIRLSLGMCGQHPDDDDYDPEIDVWMESNLPELRFV